MRRSVLAIVVLEGGPRTPLTRPSATLSPLRGARGTSRNVALLPACGEKVPEGRMRGNHSPESRLSRSPSRFAERLEFVRLRNLVERLLGHEVLEVAAGTADIHFESSKC